MEREQLVRNRLLQLELHFKSIRYFDRRKDKQLATSLLFSDQRPNELIIIYCKEGFLTINSDDKNYIMDNNSYCIINNRAHLKAQDIDAEALEKWYELSIISLVGRNQSFKLSHENIACCQDTHKGIENYLQLIDYEDKKGELAKDEKETILQMLIQMLFTRIYFQQKNLFALKSEFTNEEIIHWLKKYIDNYYTKDISLDHLSNLISMNKYYMIRLFSEAFSASPIDYLIKVRIDKTKQLLKATNFSISHVGKLVGFGSASYFSKMFKRLNGISPSQYRKEHSQGNKENN
ncbi:MULTISPECIES: AraC family transcriptional regulator [Aerococcus]|uniref:AraC family transcriptional regulator n=1 Tax=Aerococcus TaxID=1375 RepID=UPI000DCD4B90|nr:AraC family transcriptional regulator [Aerococcus urinae]MDL5184426.1 AraC family transcriptional regulator [Aerococcus mictus]MBU5609940.1 AraC family transcriptional regulator [Aerococcus urinae]MDK6292373.1 AraC family transcriptional regulator [Aerococcus urinae]MDK6375930.1 AraC family transcriptional regulator [Aerococcus urinae]MDK6420678.1 AraC family transcriptional regulator [Aerococcus urinae]